MCLSLWKNLDTDIDLRPPQRRLTYGFIRFSHPTVDLVHFFYSCLDPGWIKYKENQPGWGCNGNFGLRTRNPFHGIVIMPLLSESDCGEQGSSWVTMPPSHHSLGAKALSHVCSQTLCTKHPWPSFKLFSCLLPYNWEMAHWTKAAPQGQAVCNMLINIQANVFQMLLWIIFPSFLPMVQSSCWLQIFTFCLRPQLPSVYCMGLQLSLSPLSASLCLIFLKSLAPTFPQHCSFVPGKKKSFWKQQKHSSKGHRVTSSLTWSLFISGF